MSYESQVLQMKRYPPPSSSGPGGQSSLEEGGREEPGQSHRHPKPSSAMSPQLVFLPMEISQDNATPSIEA